MANYKSKEVLAFNLYAEVLIIVTKFLEGVVNRLLKISEKGKVQLREVLPSEEDVNKLALYFQNFSDQTRIKILSALAIKELCVNDLSKILGINQTTISHQLRGLKDQNLVDFKREGKILTYSLKSQMVNEMMMYAVKNLA